MPQHKTGKYVNCNYCQKSIYRTAYQLKESKYQFCNRKHHFLFNIKGKEIPCDYCGKLVFKSPKDLKRTKHHFCSDKCFSNFLKRKQKVYCSYCKKILLRKPNEIKKYKNLFCDKKCHSLFMECTTKEKITNKQKYRARNLLNEAVKKGIILKRECQEIGKHFGKLEAHHYRGYSDKHALDIQWYCYYHHRQEHKRLREQGIKLSPSLLYS